MRQRLLLGPILIAALVALVVADGRIAGTPLNLGITTFTLPPGFIVFLVCCITAILGAAELALILRSKLIFAPAWLLMLGALLGLTATALPDMIAARDQLTVASPIADKHLGIHPAVLPSAAVILLVCAVGSASRGHTTKGVAAGLGSAFLAFVYLGVIFAFVVMLRVEHHPYLLLWALLVTKSCDIGAYFTGKAIGRHKLIPWLSPGKTKEGLLGGVIFSTIIAVAGAYLLNHTLHVKAPSPWSAAGAGVLFGLIGQAGDLMASLLKRDAGIKDSGRILPGFGGILDVIDSPLLVMPFAYWWLAYAMAT
jgi:phosphatidate cytidylyltransferase